MSTGGGQSVYNRQFQGVFSGQIADSSFARTEAWDNQSGVDVPAGIAVTRDPSASDTSTASKADSDFTQIANPDDIVVGITVLSFARDAGSVNLSMQGLNAIKAGAAADLMVEGPIGVLVEESVTTSDPVYVRHTANGPNTQTGRFRKSADSNTCHLLKGARWLKNSGSGAGGVVGVLYFSASVQNEAGDDTEILVSHPQVSAIALHGLQLVYKTRADRFFVVDSVDYLNPTGLAQNATNYWTISLKNGGTALATVTNAAVAIPVNTFEAMTMDSTKEDLVLPPGTVLTAAEDQVTGGGSSILPAGSLVIHGHYL